MRKLGLVAGVGLVSAGLGFAAWAATASAKTETVTGRVIDLTCYAMDKANTGYDHHAGPEDRGRFGGFACAWACVRWEGQPAGLLTADGKVYQVAGELAANSNAKIARHLAQTVTITGEVHELDGMLMIKASEVTTRSTSAR